MGSRTRIAVNLIHGLLSLGPVLYSAINSQCFPLLTDRSVYCVTHVPRHGAQSISTDISTE